MKPLKLKVAGLNSFIEEQVIDFSELTSRGLFGIFGPTGSGKSSILDAITMALYGKISRDTNEFINTEKNQLYVSFEFSIGPDRHYTIERKLKSKDDGGYQTSFCRLICQEDGKEEIIDKYTDINQAMEERVIGLKHEDFIKSVVLPQGKFSEFLQLRGRDRRDMLERILGLEEFGRKLEEKIKLERNQRRDKDRELKTLLTQYEEVNEEALQTSKEKYQDYKKEELLLRQEIEEKNTLLEEYNEIRKAQQSLAAQLEEKEKIKNNIGDITIQRNKLKMGRKALSLKPYYDKLKKDKEDQREYQESRTGLLAGLEQIEERDKILAKKYERLQKEREEKTPYLERIKAEIDQVMDLVEENKERQQALLEVKKDYQNLKQDLENSKNEINKFTDRIKRGKTLLTEKEDLENSLQISAALRKKVARGVELEKKLQEEKTRLEKILDDKNKLTADLDKDQESLKEINKKKLKFNEEFDILNKKLKDLEENSPRPEKKIYTEKEKLNTLYSELERAFDYLEEQAKRERDLEKLSVRIQKFTDQLRQIRENIKNTEKELKEKKKNKEKMDRQNISAILAGEMKDGRPCPVCGSTHHPEPAKIVENDKSKMEEEIAELDEKLLSLHKKESSLNSNIESLESELKKIKEEDSADQKKIKIIGNINKEENNDDIITNKYIEELSKAMSLSITATSFENVSEKATLSREITFLELVVDIITVDQLTQLNKIYDKLKDILEKEEKHLNSWQEDREEFQDRKTEIQKKINNFEIEITRYSEKVKQEFSSLEKIAREENPLRDKIKEGETNYQYLKEETDIENFIDYDREINEADQKREECIRDINNYRVLLEKLTKELAEADNKKNSQELQVQEMSIKIKNIRENIENNQGKINQVVGDREAVEYLKEIENKQKILKENEEQARKELNDNRKMLSNKKSDLNALKLSMDKNIKEIENAQDFLNKKIEEYGIKNFPELEDFVLTEKELDIIEEKIQSYDNSMTEIKGKIRMFEDKLEGREISDKKIELLKYEKINLERRKNELIGNIASLAERIDRIGHRLKEKQEYNHKKGKVEKELALIKEINDLVGANKFVEFVALRQLKYIAREASNRLLEITNDRYQLELDQNGEFVICDNYNGGVKRDCNTLSGGETFLTSLALALSLSSHIQLKGKAEMEFFFLDEGFGTLDTELLEIVMNSLECLKEERLSVGIISHVEELKNRVPVSLNVISAEAGLHGTKVEIKYN